MLTADNTTQESPGDEPLDERILRLLPSLTTKQQRLARALLDNELYVAFASAGDIARQAGVDAATVVRFSRMLGYEGFADLRGSVRRGVPEFITALDRVKLTMEDPHATGRAHLDVFAQDIRNIEETARLNSAETIADAIGRIDVAKRVFCIGQGISSFVADHLAHQLKLIGVDARVTPRGDVEAAVVSADFVDGDLVLMVSVWRYLTQSLMLGEATRAAGIPVIGLTDNKAAPLAAFTDVLLVALTATPSLGHSISALLTLSNVLVTGVATANPQRAMDRLSRIEAFYEEFGITADAT